VSKLVPKAEPDLIALGEGLKAVNAISARFHELYDRCNRAAGFDKLGVNRTPQQQDAALRRFELATKNTEFRAISEQVNAVRIEQEEIVEAILKIPATDRIGDSIRAAAALVLDIEDLGNGFAMSAVLEEMASRAGFEIPRE
jgi:hypothetical protein